ncbi:MAG: hypothetical protein HOW73_10285 [Polyangiaceae bacterium]|nr:hypothetical protein [Polyangiaceae bacterium]
MNKPAKKNDTFGPNPLDSRVRERFLASGHLDPKVLEKHLAELADSAERGDAIDLRQPALSATADLPEED